MRRAEPVSCWALGSGSQRTYAYLLLDHLRWLERKPGPEGCRCRSYGYMAALGAAWRGPVWPGRGGPLGARSGMKRPVGRRCVREGLLPAAALLGVNACWVAAHLARFTVAGRTAAGGPGPVAKRELPANPLAPPPPRRHPKLRGGARKLLEASPRPGPAVGLGCCLGFRIGECAVCTWPTCTCVTARGAGSCRAPHVPVCHRTGTRTGRGQDQAPVRV